MYPSTVCTQNAPLRFNFNSLVDLMQSVFTLDFIHPVFTLDFMHAVFTLNFIHPVFSVEFMHAVFTRRPYNSYRGRFRSLLLCP